MNAFTEQAMRFGPYRIYPQQRVVLEADRPLRLGRRAMDILLILLEQAGGVVSKQQLMTRVWPTSVVEDGSLRVHMAALRKALGDGQSGQRYIVTVAQRGYSFVAPFTLENSDHTPDAPMTSSARHNLPLRRARMLGREALIERVVDQLEQHRFISLVGPGGIGKTTVALKVAEQLLDRYRDGIRLLDLAPLTDPTVIVPHLASLLGLSLPDEEHLSAFLRDRQMLLVFDNCEHLLDGIALLSESLLRRAPRLHILTTSRESLRAEGEFVQRVEPLDCPPQADTDRAAAMHFAALQLFVERAMASHEHFELTDENLPQVIELCQQLDGIPLAIELAASQVGNLNLDTVLEHVQHSRSRQTTDPCGALDRHQTLHATLDWSVSLLSPNEQTCLRRLGIFKGRFTLDSASAVIVDQQIPATEVFAVLIQLVAKSLLNVETGEEEVSYHLLDTTRRYALEKLRHHHELIETQERHARRCLAIMEQATQDWEHLPTEAWIDRYSRHLEDIRAALAWGLDANAPHTLAIRLVAQSAPLWHELSLINEHGSYVNSALALLETNPLPCLDLKMTLKLAQGSFSYHTHGPTPDTLEAFTTAHRLAEQSGHVGGQLQAISGQMAVNLCAGDYPLALEQNERFNQLGLHSHEALCLSAQRLRVLALHYTGDQRQARHDAEQVIQRMAHSGHRNRFTHGFGIQYDLSVASLTVLARIQWVQGLPEQALRTAQQALDIALQINHGASVCYSLAVAGCPIALHSGDTQRAAEHVALLREQTQKHSVLLFHAWAQRYERLLSDPQDAVACPPPHGLINDILVTLCPQAVDDVMVARAVDGSAGWCAAEILRRRAETLLEEREDQQAEHLLLEALKIARNQHALAWELRSATTLAQLWQRQGYPLQARELLTPIHARLSEGFGTPDVMTASRLLDQLR